MLIVGAKGFAKEVLEVCHQNNELENLVFYDDVTPNCPEKLYDTFSVLKNTQDAQAYFENTDNRFTIGIGDPKLRNLMYNKFTKLGGNCISTISSKADIGSFNIKIGNGSNILDGVKISNDVSIGECCIIYYNSIITHDVVIGNFTEISPNVTLLGRCKIGDFCQLGSGCTILPDVKIGNNVIIGAGSVVTKDIPDNCTAVGIPAKIIEK